MCCFSGNVKSVSDTSIFCRMGAQGNQVVIYSMALETERDVAMILPIPIQENRDEKSVEFINLKLAPKLFEKLDRAFPAILPRGVTLGATFGDEPKSAALEVQSVGSFAASFVPRIRDFDRLDRQFRIESSVWESLPQYQDHGFVVFKLKAGKQKVHPMAFAYPARDREQIVFPTVHIHDGKVHAEAEFDHALYCQSESGEVRMNWQESVALAGGYVNEATTRGTIRIDEHVYKKTIQGLHENEDLVVPS